MAFEPRVSYTAEEVEQARRDQLAAAAADQETTPEDLADRYRPGSFGCHEALQVASVLNDTVDRHLCEHPAVLANPDWFALAHEAQVALWNLYQAIGEKHLRANVE